MAKLHSTVSGPLTFLTLAFYASICDIVWEALASRSLPTDTGMYSCEPCGRSFATESAYRSHLIQATVHKPIKCPLIAAKLGERKAPCKKAYRTYNKLLSHYARAHPDDPPVCPTCLRKFSAISSVQEHLNIQHDAKLTSTSPATGAQSRQPQSPQAPSSGSTEVQAVSRSSPQSLTIEPGLQKNTETDMRHNIRASIGSAIPHAIPRLAFKGTTGTDIKPNEVRREPEAMVRNEVLHKILVVPHFRCELCRWETAAGAHEYCSHLASETHQKQFRCPFDPCRKRYNVQTKLEAHAESKHRAKALPQCNICIGLFFTSEAAYNQHCEELFATSAQLAHHHALRHPLISCPQCSKFIPLNIMHSHGCDLSSVTIITACDDINCNRCASGHEVRNDVDLQPGFLKCSLCSQRFVNKTHYKIHWRLSHATRAAFAISERPTYPLPTASLDIWAHLHCDVCDVTFDKPKELQKHYKESSQHPVCVHCDKAFVNALFHEEHLVDVHMSGFLETMDISVEVNNNHPTSASLDTGSQDHIAGGPDNAIPISSYASSTDRANIIDVQSQTPRQVPSSERGMSSKLDQRPSLDINVPASESLPLNPPSALDGEDAEPVRKGLTIANDKVDSALPPTAIRPSSTSNAPDVGDGAIDAGREPWTCNLCNAKPPDPVAMLCGHVFCLSCILQELSTNSRCPTCMHPIYVRLKP
ncbi:hypothetical protein K474DRAFT_1697870 [Panus rudis PR-1116 ss-1]|nr:hypothetical protein K474DRAFT_1697870 [Panus rudis PR-1116 ss-1]